MKILLGNFVVKLLIKTGLCSQITQIAIIVHDTLISMLVSR